MTTPDAEFSNRPVSPDETVNGLRIALINIGILITIPILVTGSKLGLALGWADFTTEIAIAAVILCVLGCLIAVIAAKTRLSTYVIIQFPFGRQGAKLVNGVIALTLLGWFAITASFFGQATQGAVEFIWHHAGNLTVYILMGSILFILTAVFGFKAIDKLAMLVVPLLFAFLLYLAYLSIAEKSLNALVSARGSGLALGHGITQLVGTFIVGVTILPDYCRFAINSRHGVLAAFLTLGIGFPAIITCAAVPAILSGEDQLVALLMAMGLGLPALLLLIFASWTTNTGNIYSVGLVLRTILTRVPRWPIVVAAGTLGTLIAVLGLADDILDFLLIIGIAIPPIAGIYLADYFFVRKRHYELSVLDRQPPIAYGTFVVWLVAIAIAYSTDNGFFRLTFVPACDAILVAFALHLVIGLWSGRTE